MNKEALDALDIKQTPSDDKIFIYAVFWNDRPTFRIRWNTTGFPYTTSLKARSLSATETYRHLPAINHIDLLSHDG